VHPFDPKSALLAKHAQHVVVIHFPIALFLAGAAFDFAAHWTKEATRKATLAAAAYLNLLAAAIVAPLTIATGIAAWQWQLEGQKLKGVLLLHLILGCTSGLLICVVAWIHFRRVRATSSALPSYRMPLELLTAVIIVLTGHLGGFLSGVSLSG